MKNKNVIFVAAIRVKNHDTDGHKIFLKVGDLENVKIYFFKLFEKFHKYCSLSEY